MRPNPSERALRRLVAELAAVKADDRQAVLGELDAGQRANVSALLAAYAGDVAGHETIPAESVGAGGFSHIEGLSPWLAARLESGERALFGDEPAAQRSWKKTGDPMAASVPFSMTQTALEALRSSAAQLPPAVRAGNQREETTGRRALGHLSRALSKMMARP